MAAERNRANRFMAELLGFRPAARLRRRHSTRSLVDALILQHEADALKMPGGSEVGARVAQAGDRRQMNARALRERPRAVGQPGQRRADPQRHRQPGPPGQVRQLLGSPVVTPLDVFQAYRDQNERVAVKAVVVSRSTSFLAAGRRADRTTRSRRSTTSTRTSCPTRRANARASRSPARSRSRSSRSTALLWRERSRTSSPKPSFARITRTASRSSSSRPGFPTTSSPAIPRPS